MRRAMTDARFLLPCTHACSYVASGNDGPPSTWHITQWLFRMRTISRSNSTVVVSVSWESAAMGQKIAAAAASTATASTTIRGIVALLRLGDDVEREGERVQLVVAAELRPGAVAARLR